MRLFPPTQGDRMRKHCESRQRTPEQWARKHASQKKWYAENREKHLAACRARGTTKEGKAKKREYYLANKEFLALRSRDWKRRNKDKMRMAGYRYRDKYPQKGRNNFLKRKYGVDIAAYDQMLASQNGRCALCRSLPSRTTKKGHTLDIDHDHETGAVRGLLCRNCNNGVAHFERMQSLNLLASVNTYVSASKALTLVA